MKNLILPSCILLALAACEPHAGRVYSDTPAGRAAYTEYYGTRPSADSRTSNSDGSSGFRAPTQSSTTSYGSIGYQAPKPVSPPPSAATGAITLTGTQRSDTTAASTGEKLCGDSSFTYYCKDEAEVQAQIKANGGSPYVTNWAESDPNRPKTGGGVIPQ